MPSTVTRIRSTPGDLAERPGELGEQQVELVVVDVEHLVGLSGTSAVPSRETGTEMPSSRVPAGTNVPLDARAAPAAGP